jgi:hypothetical protein
MAKKATKALEDQGYSKLDAYCIGMYEFAQSLKKAGFDEETVMGIIVEPQVYPHWILPDGVPPEKLGDYDEEDDD